MKKILILILLCISSNAFASQVTYTAYVNGGQVTAANLNGNFNAVGQVVNGGLDNTNANTTSGYHFFQAVASLPSPGNQGSVYYLTTDNSLNFDTGVTFNKSVTSNSPANGDTLYYNSGWNDLTIGGANTLMSSNGTLPSWGFTVGTAPNNIVQLNSFSSLPSVGAGSLTGVGTSNISGAFGVWAVKSAGSAIQATTDGILTGFCTANSNPSNLTVSCITDSSSSPSTIRNKNSISSNSLGTDTMALGCMTPVRKNDYYEVTCTSDGSPATTVYFLPLGS